MTNYSGSISKIESFSKFDGPGIRSVVFLSGCNLRCKYCHNPEMWKKESDNITSDELVEKLLRNKPYFKNGGGVTFSGGEPLLQKEFLLDVMKKLKEEDINITLDTAGYVSFDVSDVLKYVDLVLLDIKHVERCGYHSLTGGDISVFEKFIDIINKFNIPIWIRQVIVPGINDNILYMEKLKKYLKRINNIEKIEFLPFHRMGFSKYEELGIDNPLKDTPAMDKDKCEELYNYFLKI